MPRVHFVFNAARWATTACILAARLGRVSLVHVLCPQGPRLHNVDERLWEYEDTAFVPHAIGEANATAGCRIVLVAAQPKKPAPWLISLHAQPVDINGCRDIIEIVTAHSAHRERSRQFWRHYEAAGCQLHRHNLNHNQLPVEETP